MMQQKIQKDLNTSAKQIRREKRWANIRRDRVLYIMLIPFVLWFVFFYYKPLVGIQIAFKDYKPLIGIWESKWVGFVHFKNFFLSPYAWRVIRNTFAINFYELITVFPLTIIAALIINEIPHKSARTAFQTVFYLPHFISTVIVAGLVVSFLSPTAGVVNIILKKFGFDGVYFLAEPAYFQPIYVAMNAWKSIGFGTIIYTSAICSIDESLYEAAVIDGANRFKRIMHITIPGILPTISVMLIMRIGHMLSLGSETIILLYQPITYETADVISTFVYRNGLIDSNYSYATAVGLFNTIISLMLVTAANKVSKKLTETSLW